MTHRRPPILLLGVGSELRSDDAAGRRVVDRLAGCPRALRGVEFRTVHQLAPELADEFAGRRLVLVVDAAIDRARVTVTELPTAVDPGGAAVGALSHHLDVPTLVRLADRLGSAPGRVVLVGVPANDLTLGTELSPAADRAVDDAVAVVRDVLGPGP